MRKRLNASEAPVEPRGWMSGKTPAPVFERSRHAPFSRAYPEAAESARAAAVQGSLSAMLRIIDAATAE